VRQATYALQFAAVTSDSNLPAHQSREHAQNSLSRAWLVHTAEPTNNLYVDEVMATYLLGALDGVVAGWTRELSARELAVEFRRVMQARPELIGRRLNRVMRSSASRSE